MRRLAVISTISLLGLAAAPLWADSTGAPDIPEPVEAPAPADVAPAKPDETAKPVVIESTVVAAPAPDKSSDASALAVTSAAPTPAPEGSPSAHTAYRRPAGRFTTQYHSAYRVNKVVVELPAGIRVITRKDWYTANIMVVYAENPYSSWNGVRPESFAFVHEKETLRIVPSGTKYMPKEITVYVRPSVSVQVM